MITGAAASVTNDNGSVAAPTIEHDQQTQRRTATQYAGGVLAQRNGGGDSNSGSSRDLRMTMVRQVERCINLAFSNDGAEVIQPTIKLARREANAVWCIVSCADEQRDLYETETNTAARVIRPVARDHQPARSETGCERPGGSRTRVRSRLQIPQRLMTQYPSGEPSCRRFRRAGSPTTSVRVSLFFHRIGQRQSTNFRQIAHQTPH